jgi:hypothetical protein
VTGVKDEAMRKHRTRVGRTQYYIEHVVPIHHQQAIDKNELERLRRIMRPSAHQGYRPGAVC